ncbi:MAG: ATP-dependent zinc metalloprotease FtsH [Christensenellales bacterium]|nr:ATP-dependent zinc metalloprotease FtsH [Christensenellales bacterium]
MKKSYRSFPIYLLIILAVFAAAQMFTASAGRQTGERVEYSELLACIEEGKIEQAALQEDTIYARVKGSSIPEERFSPEAYDLVAYGSGDTFVDSCRQLAARREGVPENQISELDLGFELMYLPAPSTPWLLEMMPYIIMTLGLMLFWMFIMRQQNGGGGKMMNFGRSTARVFEPDGNRITFADVAGAVEEKEEMQELVEFLKNPRRFTKVGARIPKGVLLVGPPGTGKTMLAKAVAGEAGVPFLSISGSDFVEMFVGVGASRVRDTFEQAKKHAPCIVFIDEIDAVGRRRGAGMGGGHDEREQTLNQLLVEMDGFAVNEGVIVLAATNRKDILDPALLRPGRFDRQISVGYPDVRGREAILKVHAKDKPLAADVDLANIAKRTPYFAGADLENIMNEAAILCAREGKEEITARHLNDAIERVEMGPEKRSHVVTQEDKRLVAVHEAGHAIVGELLEGCDAVHLVTIMPRGSSGGHTLLLPEKESDFTTRTQLLDFVAMALGGYAAENLVMGEMTTGASSDLQRATDICRRMVMQYGMSDEMGPIYLGGDHDEVFLARDYGQQSRTFSESVASRIDGEVQAKMSGALARATQILAENRSKLDGLTALLMERETLDRREFEAFMKGEALPAREDATADVTVKAEPSDGEGGENA